MKELEKTFDQRIDTVVTEITAKVSEMDNFDAKMKEAMQRNNERRSREKKEKRRRDREE